MGVFATNSGVLLLQNLSAREPLSAVKRGGALPGSYVSLARCYLRERQGRDLLHAGEGLLRLPPDRRALAFMPRLEMPARLSDDLVAYVASGIDKVTGREICRNRNPAPVGIDLSQERATK